MMMNTITNIPAKMILAGRLTVTGGVSWLRGNLVLLAVWLSLGWLLLLFVVLLPSIAFRKGI